MSRPQRPPKPPKLRLRPTVTVRRGGWVFWILFALLILGALARLLKGTRF
jgi:apolipoprotein N-acyltransferase